MVISMDFLRRRVRVSRGKPVAQPTPEKRGDVTNVNIPGTQGAVRRRILWVNRVRWRHLLNDDERTERAATPACHDISGGGSTS